MRSSSMMKLLFLAGILVILVYFSQLLQVTQSQVSNYHPPMRTGDIPGNHEKSQPKVDITRVLSQRPVEQPISDEKKTVAVEKNVTEANLSFEKEMELSQNNDDISLPKRMEKVNAVRKNRLSEVCVRLNVTDNVWNSTAFQRQNSILVSDKHKAVLCATGDVDSENFKKILSDEGLPSDESKRKSNTLRSLTSYRPESISYRLKYYYKFMVTQEPLVRFLSVYKSWLLPHPGSFPNGSNQNTAHELRNLSRKLRLEYDPESFYDREPNATKYARLSDFASHVINQSKAGRKQHLLWESNNNLCLPCRVKYDYIMRSETILDDAEYVLQQLHDSPLKKYPTGHMDSSDAESIKELRDSLSPELTEQLCEVYSDDFLLFGYPKSWN